jgi:Arc/MetJ family transcription regulator
MDVFEKITLTDAYNLYIYICMRTTLNIDEEILEQASRLTGVKEKTSLVRMGLQSLIARESARRLAKFGGTEPDLKSIPRRRSSS